MGDAAGTGVDGGSDRHPADRASVPASTANRIKYVNLMDADIILSLGAGEIKKY